MSLAQRQNRKTEKEKKETLTQYLNDLYINKILFKLPKQEVDDIRETVIKIVNYVSKRIGSIDERLKISEVILVGSSREGTQICLPDEYDFLLVLQTLSQNDVLQIKKVCSGKENCVHAILNDGDLKRQFSGLLNGDELRSTGDNSFFFPVDGLREAFHAVMKEAICECADMKIQTPTGYLSTHYRSVKIHGPAFNPSFKWYSRNGRVLDISVDLCPVIRLVGDFPELINSETVTCEAYLIYAREIGSLMLLPCKKGYSCEDGLCFSVIMTETEMALMKDLSEHHRKCYKLLKYLLNANQRQPLGSMFEWLDNTVEPPTAFFSYILKVLVLNHHYKHDCPETECLASCLERVLHEMLNIVHSARMIIAGIPARNWLTNPFFKNHNIWSSHSLKFADRDLAIKLRLLLVGLDIISCMNKYNYENCHLTSVRGTNVSLLAMPLATALLYSLGAIYMYPEFGHLFEKTCTFLIWKHIELGRIIWFLDEPLECKNEKCCLPVSKRRELMKKHDAGLSLDGIYLMAAFEISILAVYIYPECGHLIGDMSQFIFRKFQELWRDY